MHEVSYPYPSHLISGDGPGYEVKLHSQFTQPQNHNTTKTPAVQIQLTHQQTEQTSKHTNNQDLQPHQNKQKNKHSHYLQSHCFHSNFYDINYYFTLGSLHQVISRPIVLDSQT